MKITRFWARGFRSLQDVELDGLGDFNVFYGPNGSGKSNVMAAVVALFRLLPLAFKPLALGVSGIAEEASAANTALERSIITRDDFNLFARPLGALTLGAVIERSPRDAWDDFAEHLPATRVEVELTVSSPFPLQPSLTVSKLAFDGEPRDVRASPLNVAEYVLLTALVPASMLRCIDATRLLRDESEESIAPDPGSNTVAALLAQGRLKQALFEAKNTDDIRVRDRLERLKTFLEGPPLHRPRFDVTRDAATRRLSLRERVRSDQKAPVDLPLDLAGLGIVQVYAILANILLGAERVVAIEEPEAHLHAPTTGRDLRELLLRLVREGHVDQLFIATHSNLFDLDPAWYWDVSLVEGATRIERRPLDELDARHLYEPGPAKHALLRSLEYLAPDTVVFQQLSDGAPITAAVMCDLLRRDAREADDYLAAVYGNAVRSVRRLAQTAAASKPERPT